MADTFLALGDSYTIGEGVPLYHSFPYQTVQNLRTAKRLFAAPEILAQTGWTTDELQKAIAATRLLPSYDFVSLLIGVNNQYRGRDLAEYTRDFTTLFHQAIRFADNRPDHVFILSIPDWGATPFARQHLPDAKGRDQTRIATEIDAFNTSAKNIANAHEVEFIDITTHSRTFGHTTSPAAATTLSTAASSNPAIPSTASSPANPSNTSPVSSGVPSSAPSHGIPPAPTPNESPFATDGLHPSRLQYEFWAAQLSARILAAGSR